MQLATVLRVARSHLGVRETARNRGVLIDKWQRGVGLILPEDQHAPGHPWCACYVCGVIREANGGVRPLWWHDSASALGLVAHNGGLLLADKRLIRPGNVYVMDHGQGRGHCGFVDSVINVRGVITFPDISGNSNDEGGREGVEVCSNLRALDDPHIVAILRLPLA